MRGDVEHAVVVIRPGRRLLRAATLSVVGAVAVVLAFGVGYEYGFGEQRRLQHERNELLQRLDAAAETEARVRRELADSELGQSIERRSEESSRRSFAALEQEIVELREELTFYRRLAKPAREGDFRIVGLVFEQDDRTREVSYRLSLTQFGSKRGRVEGRVEMRIIGRTTDGNQRTLPGAAPVPFSFRYFQDLQGRLELPAGFSPTEVEVVARGSGGPKPLASRIFEWPNKET